MRIFLLFLLFSPNLFAQTAKLQLIHNAADSTVDVYVNNALFVDNFQYRGATAFIDVNAGAPVSVAFAPASSTSSAESFAVFPVNIEAGKQYIAMAIGGVSSSSTFDLLLKSDARTTAVNSGQIDFAVFHGSPDAPNVDIYEFFQSSKLVTNLGYGKFTDYVSVSEGIYDLRIEQANSLSTFSPHFRADLRNLLGNALTVFASGSYTTGEPEFGLYAASANGTVIALGATPFAEVQFLHTAPMQAVDIYLNKTRKLPVLQFRNAIGFTELPAERSIEVSISTSPSSSSASAFYETDFVLEENKAYVFAAAGVPGAIGATAFNVFVKPNARVTANNANSIAVQVFHGSLDAPEIDVISVNGNVLFDNLEYGEFSNYINLPAIDQIVYITPANNNTQILGAYIIQRTPAVWPIPTNGSALTLFASGYWSGNPAFSMWLARQSGTTYPLSITSDINEIGKFGGSVSFTPNPVADQMLLQLSLEKSQKLSCQIVDLMGRTLIEEAIGSVPQGESVQLIQTANLQKGMYVLRVHSESGTVHVRFVKE